MIDNLWIICGCSPFIGRLGLDKTDTLARAYPSIGINMFPVYGSHNCSHWIFLDHTMPSTIERHHKGQRIIAPERYSDHRYFKTLRPDYTFYTSRDITQADLATHSNIDSKANERPIMALYGSQNSSLPALNFALLNGAQNALLLGVDFNPVWAHFYSSRPPQHNPSNSTLATIKHQLLEFKTHMNLYTLNPDNTLDLDVINYEDLL